MLPTLKPCVGRYGPEQNKKHVMAVCKQDVIESARSKLARHLAQVVIDPPLSPTAYSLGLPPGLLGENVGHACEGRANHDQQLCPGMGFHTLAPLLRDLPYHNGERINVLFATLNSPTHN